MTASMTRWEFLVALAKVVGVIGTGVGGLAYYATQLKTPEGADRMDKSEWENEVHGDPPARSIESNVGPHSQDLETRINVPTLAKLRTIDGHYLGSGQYGRLVFENGDMLQFYDGQLSHLVNMELRHEKSGRLAISPDGKYLAMYGYDGPAHQGDEIEKQLKLKVFEIGNARLRKLFEKDVPNAEGIEFSNDSGHLALYRKNGVYEWSKEFSPERDIEEIEVTLLDTNTWREAERYAFSDWEGKGYAHIRFSADNTFILIKNGSTVTIERGKSGTPPTTYIFAGWTYGYENIEIDGNLVIGTTQDGKELLSGVRIWNKYEFKPSTAYVCCFDYKTGDPVPIILEQGRTDTSLSLLHSNGTLYVGNESTIRVYSDYELQSITVAGGRVMEMKSTGKLLMANLAGIFRTDVFLIK